jgi:solute carrier family 8 (sodium/calcium exchanger)
MGSLSDDVMICEAGGSRVIVPELPGEADIPLNVRAILYCLALLWCFLGVAIVADIFMAAIERITSTEKKVLMDLKGGTKKPYLVRVWNPTVANLTLMALGSSAPEILLSVIELFSGSMYSGELGPSTIVGSAAFNLLMILAICVATLPVGQTRKIADLGVYICTASASVLAYVWLVIILQVISPDIIDPWEGIVTFLAFPILVLLAYLLDIGWFSMETFNRTQKRNGNRSISVVRLCMTPYIFLTPHLLRTPHFLLHLLRTPHLLLHLLLTLYLSNEEWRSSPTDISLSSC